MCCRGLMKRIPHVALGVLGFLPDTGELGNVMMMMMMMVMMLMILLLGTVACICNPTTQAAKEKWARVQGQQGYTASSMPLWLDRQVRPCFFLFACLFGRVVCSYGGPKFSSQHLYGSSWPPVTLAPGDLTPVLASPSTAHVHEPTHRRIIRKTSQIFKKKIRKLGVNNPQTVSNSLTN